MLTGEFIRRLNDNRPRRKRQVEQQLLKMIEYGGALLYHGGEDQQRSLIPPVGSSPGFLSVKSG